MWIKMLLLQTADAGGALQRRSLAEALAEMRAEDLSQAERGAFPTAFRWEFLFQIATGGWHICRAELWQLPGRKQEMLMTVLLHLPLAPVSHEAGCSASHEQPFF